MPAALLLDTQSHRRVLLQRRARDQVAAETGDESVPGRNEFRITIWSFKSSVSSHIRTANRFRAAGRVIQSKLFIEPFLCSYDVGERQNGAVWIAAGVSRGYRFDAIKQREEEAFKKTFETLAEKMGADAFRKYDSTKRRFMGGFSISGYELVAFGLGFNVDDLDDLSADDLRKKIKKLWDDPEFVSSSGSGIRGSSRIPKTVPLGRNVLKP